ncbi:carbohydrate ABC transporter permease [Bifidobacterium callitrichos]|uniref:carbohydrate ABC transporter permease n=1 Tax=Bifidobacterium callitrichos TaxID=762209 RepID=UPI002158D9F4|nr:sugar ABC transporter permease [Bifidobacterium callitrichos]
MSIINESVTADHVAGKRKTLDERLHPFMHAFPYIAPHLIIFAVFGIIPIVFGLYISFTRWNLIGSPKWAGLDNFRLIMTPGTYFNKVFFKDLWNTLLFVVINVPLCIVVPLLLAVLLNKKGLKGAGLFQAILYIPGLISVAAGALVWKMVFNSQYGMINTTFHLQVNWLGEQPWAWITIFVLSLWAGIGGNLVIYRSALSGVDQNLYEAAQVDGAGPVRIFFSITLPEIRLPLFYTTIMTTVGAFNVWGQPLMMTNGGPAQSTQVLLMDIKNLAFPAGPSAAGMASAMALLLGIILMILSIIQIVFMNKED